MNFIDLRLVARGNNEKQAQNAKVQANQSRSEKGFASRRCLPYIVDGELNTAISRSLVTIVPVCHIWLFLDELFKPWLVSEAKRVLCVALATALLFARTKYISTIHSFPSLL